MKLSRMTIAALVLFGLASGASAQTGTARGKILDPDGAPVAGAKITIESLEGYPGTYEVETNEDGEFRQVGMRPGKYRFTVHSEGHAPTFAEYGIGLGDPTTLPDIVLQGGGADPERAKVNALFEEAIGLAQSGSFDQAQAKLEEAIAIRPDFPEAYYNLGYVAIQREDWTAAEAALNKALELRGSYNDARMALSSVYQKTGRNDEAAALIEESAAGGGDARVFFNLGIMKLNAGDAPAAIEAFTKASELDPANPEPLYHLATLALQQGRTDDAVATLEKYLAASPTNEENIATAKGLLQALKP